MVSRVPMTSMLLLESRISEDCTEAAVALCGGGGQGLRSRFFFVRQGGNTVPRWGMVVQKLRRYEDDRREDSAKDGCSGRFEDDRG